MAEAQPIVEASAENKAARGKYKQADIKHHAGPQQDPKKAGGYPYGVACAIAGDDGNDCKKPDPPKGRKYTER